jgi:gliding motility-associated-like protein
MKQLIILFVGILLLIPFSSKSQFVLYRDIVKGGVTYAGGSTGGGWGTFYFDAVIPTGSTIHKAFLICFALGEPENITITLNNKDYNLNPSSIATTNFVSAPEHFNPYTPSSINVIDVTPDIIPTISEYEITVPPQVPGSNLYSSFYLCIIYNNPVLTETATEIILNKQNVSSLISYTLTGLNPVSNNFDVGFSFLGLAFCYIPGDGSYVHVNGTNLGLTGGNDYNSPGFCSGVQGHFYYYNNTLYGLGDDTANATMNGTDALANIQSYLTDNATSLNIDFVYEDPNWAYGSLTNPVAALFLAYTTPCQAFEATVTHGCLGDSVQLSATGGINYEWLPQQDLSCYNCPNPVFTGNKTTTYTCRIWSTDSCSKVLPLRVFVPKPDTVYTTQGICGNDDAAFSIGNISNGTPPYTYSINTGQSNNTGMFNNLGAGTYTYTITDSMGCSFSDTIALTEKNLTKARFNSEPFKGEAPLYVFMPNHSENANYFVWILPNGDTLYTEDIHHVFDSAGTFTVTLWAYNSYPHCSSSVTHTIYVEQPLFIMAPNVFTPNGDGINDVFNIKVKGAKEYRASIINRWGQELYQWSNSEEEGWQGNTQDGKACSDGVYFWIISGISEKGEPFEKNGMVHLLR